MLEVKNSKQVTKRLQKTVWITLGNLEIKYTTQWQDLHHPWPSINICEFKAWTAFIQAGIIVLLISIPVYLLEKEMATHSSTLGWKIPWGEEPGGL